ncbi:hypothetical protein L7F22_043564 [Adiantum nelumboides]|nr:hypothetical protein [Adiantum nelumboides]
MAPSSRPSLGGNSSLATLQRAYGEMQELEASTQDSSISYASSSNPSRQAHDVQNRSANTNKPSQSQSIYQQQFQQFRDTASSPAFSIDAVSENEDDVISSMMRASNSRAPNRSPRIGDLTWSHEETGPFDMSATAMEQAASQSSNRLQVSGRDATDSSNRQSAMRAGSFDLNAAIADLLQEDEHRRQTRRDAGIESATPETLSRLSSPEDPDPIVRGKNSTQTAFSLSQQPSTPIASGSRTKRSASGATTNDEINEQNMATPRRARNGSTASIGQTLLRGSLPLGAAEDYEGRLSGIDDAAAEALRKLDGISTPRSNTNSIGSNKTARDPSRSPRSSRQISRPGSASHRTSGNMSRGSSPSARSVATNITTSSALPSGTSRTAPDDSSSRTSASRRASRTIASPSLHGIESPRRTSLSSPRARRSQLPPLPTTSAALPLGLSTPPAPSAPLPIQSVSYTTAVNNPPLPNNKRASGTSVASITSTAAPRTSTSTKSKRGSDISLPAELVQSGTNNAGLGLATAMLEDGGVGGQSTLDVPPVPPLPKAWESSRSINNIAAELSTTDQSPSMLSQSVVSQNSVDSAVGSESAMSPYMSGQVKNSSQSTKSPSLKWSLANFGQSLTSKKSEERLAARSNAGDSSNRRTSLGSGRSSLRPERRVSQPVSDDKTIKTDTSASMTANSSSSSLLASTPASISAPRMSTENSIRSPSSTASPKTRRTPSFFRKRSSEIPSDDAKRGKKSPSLRNQERPSSQSAHSVTGDGSGDAPYTNGAIRSEATTPSGRSSRKSILGLGSLLRSASKKNLDSMPTSAPAHLIAKGQQKQEQETHRTGNGVQVIADDSLSSIEQPKTTKTPSKSGPLNTMRRASLIGRKRGKTLSSANENEQPTPAQTLPPMQMPPLNDMQLSPPRRKDAQSAMRDGSSNDSITTRRRLANSSSTGDLVSAREKSNAPSLPTINASPSTVTSAQVPEEGSQAEKRTVSGGLMGFPNSPAEPVVPASRIPRASKRQSLAASQSSSIVRRLSGVTGSNLSSSKTSTSLASHLGISNNNHGASMDQTNDSIMSQDISSPNTASSSSSTLVSILTAYTNAKTPAEVEVVLRRAKVASYSSTLAPREKDVLVSLIARQEEKRRQTQNGGGGGDAVVSGSNVLSTPQSQRTLKDQEKTPTSVRISKDALSASVGAPSNIVPFTTSASTNTLNSSVPARRARVSMTAISNSSKAAREATLAQQQQTSSRLSTPSSARASPALTETVLGRSTTSTVSPSPTGFATIDDEEREGDEEIEAYIRRRHARKVAQGARLADLEKLLEFPEDERPSKSYSYRQAEALWGDKLTNPELEEIRNFKEIYFVGQNVDKNTRIPSDGSATQNGGYDDERGDYLVINHDHLAYRYEVMSLLGRGSFGQVLQCKDHKTGKYVAIKLIRNKRRFHHQALVEVKILENLCKWDPNEEFNVIRIQDSFYFRNHLCISMELLSINLYELIKANSFAGFSTKLIRRVTSQVLLSLSLLRRNRVVHCDLKPENILLMHPRRSAIKVIDFGSSCFEHEKVYTYIQSRFYRSPEVILGMNYHTAIDIWSLGCIIAELYSGYPLFPGENEQEQLACIMEILGVPDRYLIDRSSRKKLFFDSTGAPRPVVNSKGKRRRPATKSLRSALNCDDEVFLDFLAKCLHWDPERRIKPDAALRHPWIKRTVTRHEVYSGATRRVSTLNSNGTSSVTNTPRRSLAASNTTASLSSAAMSGGSGIMSSKQMNSGSGMSISTSTPKLTNNSTTNAARNGERRMSLRSSVNNTTSNNASNDTVKHTPLRASQRNQQPVQ